MKKLLLIIAVFFISLTPYAQQYVRATHLQPGIYNEKTKKWDWGVTQPVDNIDITLKGNNVYIDNKAQTHITSYEDMGSKTSYDEDGDKYTLHTWKAVDEKQRKCLFLMTTYIDLKLEIYSIIYSDMGFRYYISTNNLDKLLN
jgi:hypothetical protein